MPFATLNGVQAAGGMQGTTRAPATFNGQPAPVNAPMGMAASQYNGGAGTARGGIDGMGGSGMGAGDYGVPGIQPNPGGGGSGYGSAYNRASGMMAGGVNGTTTQQQNSQATANGHGVTPGVAQQSAVPQQAPPTLESIQQEMARRGVGAQLNANPQNSALAGYMMG